MPTSEARADTRRAIRVVLAPDKFKGSLTADQVCDHLAAGLTGADRAIHPVAIPVADGGDGTVAAVRRRGGTLHSARARDPLGEWIDANFADFDGVAVIELAAASGLAFTPPGHRAPMAAGSEGTGDLIRAALDLGYRTIVLGLGGSASTDGGAGMVRALGARVLDRKGRDVASGGAALADAAVLDLTDLDPRLADTEIVLASDVDNPLTGPHGAAAVFAPQKGATPLQVTALDTALTTWAALVGGHPVAGTADGGRDAAAPGAGAAGGVGFAALAILDATMRPGIDVILEVLDFDDALSEADLVITGEGSLDAQSLRGKAPVGVARRAREAGVPVIAVVGRRDLSAVQARAAGFDEVHALTDLESDPRVCMTEAGRLLRQIGAQIGERWRPQPW